ncbi:MAG: manganese-dependent inorganic pyrophosphatase [Candidatus Paceibacteria bacterium]|jgi:manganese-dependent inorganic pyrophosphatase
MENMIKVFGHRSPDTDATSSAIVWAWYLKEHRNKNAQAYILSQTNTEALFVLDYWDVALPETLETVSNDDNVAIVDTNNADELFENINETNIISIIDHHKLTGGLRTDLPMEVVIQPYASTMTVMYNVMNIEPEDFPREIAGLMLSGIISDTLEFRSPTSTPDDKNLAEQLALVLDINISEYADQMFAAKSDIGHFSDEELLRLDSKIFSINEKSTRVSVLETTCPQMVLDRKDGIIAAMPKILQDDNVEQVFLFIIDILKQEAVMLIPDNNTKIIAEAAFEVIITEDTITLSGIVSRKKQILPALTR